MTPHTPGPWAVHPKSPTAVYQPEFECWIPQSEADARLIAAAPDLLEALQALLNAPKDLSVVSAAKQSQALAQARSAIDKATKIKLAVD